MVPRMAAVVWNAPVLLMFLFVCSVFSQSISISFTRDELLDIRQHTPDNFFPFLEYSDALLDVLVGGAAVLVKRALRRKRGKRAGALVKLRERGFRTALPSIHLANLRSLPNKMDELLLLTRTNKDFSNCAALCFTETWPSKTIPDNALHLPGYQLFRSDHITELTGKTRGGGLCFYKPDSKKVGTLYKLWIKTECNVEVSNFNILFRIQHRLHIKCLNWENVSF